MTVTDHALRVIEVYPVSSLLLKFLVYACTHAPCTMQPHAGSPPPRRRAGLGRPDTILITVAIEIELQCTLNLRLYGLRFPRNFPVSICRRTRKRKGDKVSRASGND